MARIRRLTGARAWAARLSGLLVLAAIVALIVAGLPAQAGAGLPSGNGVVPTERDDLGGQTNDCFAVGTNAPFEFRIENPRDKSFTDPGPGGATFTLSGLGASADTEFGYFTPDALVFDIVVKGGKKSTLFANEAQGKATNADTELHGPTKGNSTTNLFKVSHVSICYTTTFGTVSGAKWHDHDQNGVIGGGGENAVESGVEGWTISAFADNDSLVASTTTDANGDYTLALVPGAYRICEEARPPAGGQTGWAQSAPDNATCDDLPGQSDGGHSVTVLDGVPDAGNNFGNFETVFADCGSTLTLGGNVITFPPEGPLCDKPNTEYVYETYVRANGDQVVDFTPLSGATGTAKIIEVFVFSINEIQNSTTLMYNDIIPIVVANDRVALYCNHDPRDPDTGLLDENLVPPNMDVLPGPGTGGAEPDGSHTTCIIESVENADGTRTDTLYTEIDGRAWM